MGATIHVTRKVFTKLLALFVLLLVFQTVGNGADSSQLCGATLRASDTASLGREALWSGLIAFASHCRWRPG